MQSLREHFVRLPEVRPRTLAGIMAPALSERSVPVSPRMLEESAAFLFAHVAQQSGPFREQLLSDRRRFVRLVDVVHRLPCAPRELTEGGA
jgi:hypothetical protein